MADKSSNIAFTTDFLKKFIKTEFSDVILTDSENFTGDETYLKIAIPVHCPFYVIVRATHLGVRGCYEFEKFVDFNRLEHYTQPACMVLMDEYENILLSIKLKNTMMLRMSLRSILVISGPEIVQKQGTDATDLLEVIKEIKGIVNKIIEKHPDAFKT